MTAPVALVGHDVVRAMDLFFQRAQAASRSVLSPADRIVRMDALNSEWRALVRMASGLPAELPTTLSLADMSREFGFLLMNQAVLHPVFRLLSAQRVLFAGQCYYNPWYLSRGLRQQGWKADLLNWDLSPDTQIYYHGHDFAFTPDSSTLTEEMFAFYLSSLYAYDVFHFSNMHGMSFGEPLQAFIGREYADRAEIRLLKGLGKRVAYTNNGCMDGVSQTSFATWGSTSVCSICRWRDVPSVCNDARSLAWGKFRNDIADFQCLSGGNRIDFNDDPRVHEVPEFYCLDADVWNPALEIPQAFRLADTSPDTVRLYHAVGHKSDRTTDDGVNIKSSHVYLPLITKLQREGVPIELLAPSGIANRDVRFLQAQSHIVLDMLSYGWFGANAREAMMLGIPVICYIRPEWLESVRQELPDYASDLPIVQATPETVEAVLRDLIAHPAKRAEIGTRSRAFAVKWHGADNAARRFSEIYGRLLAGDLQRRDTLAA